MPSNDNTSNSPTVPTRRLFSLCLNNVLTTIAVTGNWDMTCRIVTYK